MGRSSFPVFPRVLIPVIAPLLLALPALASGPESLPLGKGSNLVFATVAEGSGVLGVEDDFTRRMSPFESQY